MRRKDDLTPLGRRLLDLAKYKEYEVWLLTPGLAFEFNEFCKHALEIEERLEVVLGLQNDLKKWVQKRRQKDANTF